MDHDLDLSADGGALTAARVDIASVSGEEGPLADAIERALSGLGHLSVHRDGNTVVARTDLGRAERAILAGHIDTVPHAGNFPSTTDAGQGRLYGCGTSDMKSGIAVMLRLAAGVGDPKDDVTYVFYDHEETDAAKNGLGRLTKNHRDWLDADLALLMEPTANRVEAGCQGTLRVLVAVPGRRAHSARSWLGDNAIHKAGDVLTRLASYDARRVEIDGCEFREGLNAVRIEGGVSGNVVPDRATITVNFRFAPDRSEAEALAHVGELLAPYECVLTDSAPGALPGLGHPAVADFVRLIGAEPVAKLGWTDVARFASLGVPALNFGPGDPNLAHSRDEYVETGRITECERMLRSYLGG